MSAQRIAAHRSRSGNSVAFVTQKPALDLQLATARIAGKATESVNGYDAMTGYDDRTGIGSARPADCTGAGSELPRELAISDRPSGRDFPQRLPDTALKWRAL